MTRVTNVSEVNWSRKKKNHILLHGDGGQGGDLREENEFDSEILTGWILTVKIKKAWVFSKGHEKI